MNGAPRQKRRRELNVRRLQEPGYMADRDREVHGGCGDSCHDDADHSSFKVEHGSAGIARLNASVHLNADESAFLPTKGGDPAHIYGDRRILALLENETLAEWKTNRDEISELGQIVVLSKLQSWQIFTVLRSQKRQVQFAVEANYASA